MNAYWVHIPEIRNAGGWDGFEPSLPVRPCEVVCAESPAAAKYEFLREFAHQSCSGVETDDWPYLRVRLLWRNVPFDRRCGLPLPVGDPEDALVADMWYYRLWLRVHEVEGVSNDPPVGSQLDS